MSSIKFLKVILQPVHVLRRARTTDVRREGARGTLMTSEEEFSNEETD